MIEYVIGIFVAGIITCFAMLRLFSRRYNLPNGPRGWPVIGNMLKLKSLNNFHYHTKELSDTYGDIFLYKFGPRAMDNFVILNSIEAANDAFVKCGNDLSGRTEDYGVKAFRFNDGIAFCDYNQALKNRRNIAGKALRTFLLGDNLEKVVHKGLDEVINTFDQLSKSGAAFDPVIYMNFITYNIIAGVLYSKTYKFDDEDFKFIYNANKEIFSAVVNGLDETYLPEIATKFYMSKKTKTLTETNSKLYSIYVKILEEHKTRYAETGEVNDMIDHLMKVQEERDADSVEEIKKLGDMELLGIILDFFGAGTDTVASTLTWIIFFMIKHPEVQEKVYSDIQDVYGTDSYPTLDNRHKLAYVEAVQYECMRMGMAAPVGLPHRAMKDTKLRDFDIPKDYQVILNHYALHFDPKQWDKPFEFIPERFLDEDGKLGPKPKSFLPFSSGRRQCIGENVAKPETFLIFTSLIQRFKIESAPKDQKLSSVISDTGLPNLFKISLVKRK